MDYEKKYKEALKKAEAFYFSATTEPITEREVLANIFPELKENEDEKIRKNIIIALKSQKDELEDFYVSHNTSESELVSWIEKQGEQKLVSDWSEDDKKYLRRAINATRNGYPETNNWLKSLKDRVQLQQKHAWSEEDEIGLADAMWAIGQARSIAKDENDMGNLWYAEDWLKSIKERIGG